MKGLLLMQLPHPMEVTGSGAPFTWVALGLGAKLRQSLHEELLLQGFEGKLRGRYHGGKELMKLKHADTLKPHRSTVNTAQKSLPRRAGFPRIDRLR